MIEFDYFAFAVNGAVVYKNSGVHGLAEQEFELV
jgi:hypothetical protein